MWCGEGVAVSSTAAAASSSAAALPLVTAPVASRSPSRRWTRSCPLEAGG